METRKIIERKYNKFIEQNGCEPQFLTTYIRWKDDEDEKWNCAIISWGDGESDPHDEEVLFHASDWTELADLFCEDNGEDFVCVNIEDADFGIW